MQQYQYRFHLDYNIESPEHILILAPFRKISTGVCPIVPSEGISPIWRPRHSYTLYIQYTYYTYIREWSENLWNSSFHQFCLPVLSTVTTGCEIQGHQCFEDKIWNGIKIPSLFLSPTRSFSISLPCLPPSISLHILLSSHTSSIFAIFLYPCLSLSLFILFQSSSPTSLCSLDLFSHPPETSSSYFLYFPRLPKAHRL